MQPQSYFIYNVYHKWEIVWKLFAEKNGSENIKIEQNINEIKWVVSVAALILCYLFILLTHIISRLKNRNNIKHISKIIIKCFQCYFNEETTILSLHINIRTIQKIEKFLWITTLKFVNGTNVLSSRWKQVEEMLVIIIQMQLPCLAYANDPYMLICC